MKTEIKQTGNYYSFPTRVQYNYDQVTTEAASKLMRQCHGSVAAHAHAFGMYECEPLIIALDAMIVYARAHEARFESKLAEDYVLGPEWLASVRGLRGLLNGDGAAAHIDGRSTDSKDNGACESMFWAALEIAGFTESDLD